MDVPKILNEARFDLSVLARKAGVSHGYLRLVASGKRNPGKVLRGKLADALREHGRDIADLADLLEKDPAPTPRTKDQEEG